MIVNIASSLDKIFPDIGPKNIIEKSSMLKNERYNFQLCIFNDSNLIDVEIDVKIVSDISKYCQLRVVENIPAQLTEYTTKDDYYIFQEDASRVYPDLLRPFEHGDLILSANKWKSVWCTIFCEDGLPSGKHEIEFTVSSPRGQQVIKTFLIEVIDEYLPKSDLLYTNWFHYDCIAQYYNVAPWSEKFYNILGTFIDTAISHGLNIIYTPIFTPALDTKIGGERQDVQLVKIIEKENDVYEFDFSALDFFIDFCLSKGIEYFEMSHLATQWGAKACPKIMVQTVNGYCRKFGWDTDSFGEKYKIFLSQFLPKLDAYLTNKGISDKIFFHISDEPTESQYPEYQRVANYIKSFIAGYKVMDASSTTSNEIVDIPVLSTTHIPINATPDVWAYYCCTACDNYLSNRFFNMPSQRNRILGMQLYEQDRKGFLHWGFNFYNSILSYYPVNPFTSSDAGGGFPAGDSFVVYPGENWALENLRLEVFYDGLQDRRALKLLEKYLSREEVLKILHQEGVNGWTEYPRSAVWHLQFRERINEKIKEFIVK